MFEWLKLALGSGMPPLPVPRKHDPDHIRIVDVFIPPKGTQGTSERIHIRSRDPVRADAFVRSLKAEGYHHQLRCVRKQPDARRELIEDFRL